MCMYTYVCVLHMLVHIKDAHKTQINEKHVAKNLTLAVVYQLICTLTH
jgi:hypothetical protein